MPFELKKLTPREKKLLGILLLIISTIPFFCFTLPSWNNYFDTVNKINQNKSKLTNIDTHIRKLEKLKNENTELSKKIQSQKLYIAKSSEIDFLVQDLKEICDESLISLESFTPQTPEPINIIVEKQLESELERGAQKRGKLKETLEKLKGQDLPIDLYRYPIEVKITGDFTDIVELLKKLEKYGRVISIENISIGKIEGKQSLGDRLSKARTKSQRPDTGSLFNSFNLIAYSLPQAEEKLSVNLLEKGLTGPKETFKFKRKRI